MTHNDHPFVAFAVGLVLLASLPCAAADQVLHSFAGGSDGSGPYAGLIQDSAGNLYGTTEYGGSSNCGDLGCGTVFMIAPGGKETILHAFSGGSDGRVPVAGVIMDKNGNLYGTTEYGGADNQGTVFKLAPGGSETIIHSFGSGSDGGDPSAGLIQDPRGNLYGTTPFGGAYQLGTVFKIAPHGAEIVLYSFKGGALGQSPVAGLIEDNKRNLYGTTASGGMHGSGTIFMLAPDGTETVLYSFAGGSDGASPYATLARDNAGNFYGTTLNGGANNAGTVFKLASNGTELVLHAFGGGSDGVSPVGGVIRDTKGNLYGTTFQGGADNGGAVFKVAPSGTELVIYSFTNGNDGGGPWGGLIEANKGYLFGTTAGGGANDWGTVFDVKQ